ncbi:hypothetical protein L2E82_29871 [Cichorium intybus]|uniref:Uncharacterized protein n=1 Tax=Cichorium intybus TaxID=13427 RepID=A0ACB9CZ63_CICIN|nr:hypothetical protein L2E82_29871 [Cichorium intybus]
MAIIFVFPGQSFRLSVSAITVFEACKLDGEGDATISNVLTPGSLTWNRTEMLQVFQIKIEFVKSQLDSGRQELEIVMGNEHISFTTSKIGSLVDVQTSNDPEGLRIFYYLDQKPSHTHKENEEGGATLDRDRYEAPVVLLLIGIAMKLRRFLLLLPPSTTVLDEMPKWDHVGMELRLCEQEDTCICFLVIAESTSNGQELNQSLIGVDHTEPNKKKDFCKKDIFCFMPHNINAFSCSKQSPSFRGHIPKLLMS